MATYAFPDISPSEISLRLVSNTEVFASPFTQARQTFQRGGEHVVLTAVYRNLRTESHLAGAVADTNHGAVMQAFLSRLNGQQHRFTMPFPALKNLGAWSGSPLVAGASQLGITLNIDEAGGGSVSQYAFSGDWFEVNGELKMSTTTVNLTAGAATLEFRPALRSAPPDNDPIDATTPAGTFMLLDEPQWVTRPGPKGPLTDVTIVAVEDLT